MLPFTANEQVLYSAIPEMHSRHRRRLDCTRCSGLSGEPPPVIKAIIYGSWLETLMITVLSPDKPVLNNNLLFSPPFLFSLPENTRCALHIWASAIMQITPAYLPECPWTTALNNYEDYVQCGKFVIQNNSHLRSGNCCRQIRLTLSAYFCTFGDILCACLYNLIFTCKQ